MLVSEEEKEIMNDQITKTIEDEYRNYGELVDKARESVLEGYAVNPEYWVSKRKKVWGDVKEVLDPEKERSYLV